MESDKKKPAKRYYRKRVDLFNLIEKIKLWPSRKGVLHGIRSIERRGDVAIITTHCSREPGYVLQAPTLVEAIFRAFLSQANQPMTPRQLAPMVGHQPREVLRVLAGRSVRLGLRPILQK